MGVVENLFGELDASDAGEERAAEGPFAAVALEQGIDRLLDYSVPRRLAGQIKAGQLVKVPLGRKNKLVKGYLVAIRERTDYPKVKPVAAIADERVLVAGKLMELARWMSRYYVTPLGVVLDSVIPSAVKKQVGLGYTKIVKLARGREAVQELLEKTKARKRRAILARLLLLEEGQGVELVKLASEAGTTTATVRKLVKLGLITISAEADFPGLSDEATGRRSDEGGEGDLELNEEQGRVVAALEAKLAGGFSVSLLHGVTGSGKTEIYLQCIRRVIDSGKHAIVLVPEIALTPQTERRFTARFKRVAVLHSGLSATMRHRYWQQISMGMADVVVGARSAIFAPLPGLGIIVVDEEHEASYKQDTAPRYQARDVAIKRGQIEGVPVLLGSATPSLESYHRARKGESSVGLLTLLHRVRGLELPRIELVDMKQANRFRKGIHLISERLEHLIRATVEAKKQVILLLNRRGYSNFVYCVSCGNVVSCKYCDTTMTYHRAAGTHPKDASSAEGLHTGSLHCHYCLAVNPLPASCPVCGKKLSLFGLGTQRVEEEICRKFDGIRYARVDSDSMRSGRDYEQILGAFARGAGYAVGDADDRQGAGLPQRDAGGGSERGYGAGAAGFSGGGTDVSVDHAGGGARGRGDSPGRVVLQTFQPDDPTIQAAIKQDYARFATTELKHRQEVGLPPFTRMVRIVLRDQEQEKLFKLSEELGAALSEEAAKERDAVTVKGPMPCAISRIAGYFRNQVVLVSAEAGQLQRILAAVREKGALSKTDRIAVDVDPVSLL